MQLTERNLDARNWITVLIPFVAAMLARGPDFNNRFAARVGAFRDRAVQSTNGARLIELNRLLAPIAAAKGIVMQVAPGGILITNDVAFTGQRHPGGEIGLAVPAGRKHVLGVIPRTRGAVAVAQGGTWNLSLSTRSFMEAITDSSTNCLPRKRDGSSSGQTGQSWSNTYEGAQLGTSGQSGRLNLAS